MGRAGWLSPLVGSLGLAFILTALCASPGAAEVFASLGTGETNGIYYPVGKSICELVNRSLRTTGMRCSPESTPGSIYNVDALQSGELEFGIAQADVALAAYSGKGRWTGRPSGKLRSVFALYPEVVTIIARQGSGIHAAADLARKRVNVGGRGSGTRATWDMLQTALGFAPPEQVRLIEMNADATTHALCVGELDANVLMVGHPSPLVRSQLAACPTNLVAVNGSIVSKVIASAPYYRRDPIPGDLYGLSGDVPSFGVAATLMTSTDVDAKIVAVLAKAVITQIPEFRKALPALARVSTNEMIGGWLPAPLHPGALATYRELGLLK